MVKQHIKKIAYFPAKKLTQSGLLVFLREILFHPKTMGAALPSSNQLARAIARQIPLQNYHQIVELGAGTGVITAGLLAHGVDPTKLITIERSSALSKHLNKRFPALHVINGDARELQQLLGAETKPISIIVSGLPLRSLPASTVKAIGEQIDHVLAAEGLFVQFTYSLFSKPLPPSPHLRCMHSQFVWWNLPPARVDVFCKTLN